jgi:hypothetical protein
MFGHDNHDDQQAKDQTSPTPVISPAPDELVNADDDQASSAPAFDTSAVSLDGPADEPASAPPTIPAADDKNDDLLPSGSTSAVDNDLITIKQDALQQLTPLVDHLDQTPEEKFRTTMMMIQANDDQSLIKVAHAAAKQIKDDKVRAQALLDIVNEINYFTQQASN